MCDKSRQYSQDTVVFKTTRQTEPTKIPFASKQYKRYLEISFLFSGSISSQGHVPCPVAGSPELSHISDDTPWNNPLVLTSLLTNLDNNHQPSHDYTSQMSQFTPHLPKNKERKKKTVRSVQAGLPSTGLSTGVFAVEFLGPSLGKTHRPP